MGDPTGWFMGGMCFGMATGALLTWLGFAAGRAFADWAARDESEGEG